MGEYERNKKRRKKTVIKGVASFCCVCAVALAGIGMWQGVRSGTDYYTNPNGDDLLGVNPSDLTLSGHPDFDEIIFNDIDEKIPDSSEMGIALFRDDAVEMTEEELNEYFGVNIFPIIPDDLAERPRWLGIYRHDKGTGEVYHDFNRLEYANEDCSKVVAVCFGTNRIVYLTEEFLGEKYNEIEKSVICNTDVLIVRMGNGSYYYAEFSYKGVIFSVSSQNITNTEFLSVIASLLEV